ncbi:MAG: MBL fold metallo-hydrolase [Gemmatimonadota bacterium]|nr:MBL fold metallo-hydrolase [Gemmatimonadota bacterium]
MTVGPFQSNCYILGPTDAGRLVVIDPGDEGERIAAVVREAGGDVAAILLTHAHLDHVGAVAHIVREFGAPVYLHAADRPIYDRTAGIAAQYGLRLETPPPPDVVFEHGDTVRFDDVEFEVRHTPGHSPGSVTLVGGPGAFVGDAVFAGSIGRTDLPGGDTETLLDAIVKQILTLPSRTVLIPGHGPETTVAAESATNPFLADLMEPCLHCGTRLPLRLFGCKGGHCPNCGHPYPHGDCSDA